jgi:hypothetical protein
MSIDELFEKQLHTSRLSRQRTAVLSVVVTALFGGGSTPLLALSASNAETLAMTCCLHAGELHL